MYIAYRIETCDGIDYMQPVGVFRNKKDMNDFKSISPSNLNFEKVPMIDIRKISPIKYMKYWYSKDGSCGYSCGVTNSLFVKDVEKYNKVYVINGYLKITKVLKDGEDDKVVFEKLKKLSPKLLLKKEIDKLKNSDENGFRANSLFVQIDAIDLLNNI